MGWLVRAVVLWGVAFPPLISAQELGELEERAFREAAARLNPSVVQIQTVGGLDRVGGIRTGTAPTTGLVVSSDGFIVSSAFNFASRPASILVMLPDGRRLPATHVGDDLSRMLTLIKVEAEGLPVPDAFPADEMRVGQWSIALGRTLSNEFPSVSVGIISALRRVWGKAIQTDAKVSPVNYGGPLVAADGRVLGVLVPLSPQADASTAGVEWYDSGIGFAIPMDDVLRSVERLKSGETLKPGLLGIGFTKRDPNGAPAIATVRPTSPADEAGLQAEDVIVEVAGQPVSRQAQVRTLVGPLYAGEQLTMKVRRGEQQLGVELTLAAELIPFESPYLGILPERRTDATAFRLRHVLPGSPAADAGLLKGDLIERVAETDVSTAAALQNTLARWRPGDTVPLTVRTGEATRQIELKLGSIPAEVPADVPTDVVEPGQPAEGLKTGRFNVEMPAYENNYWAFVPADYNADHPYGMLVWLHPAGDTMEAAVIRLWQRVAERRGLILVGPKASSPRGWDPRDTEYVRDVVADVREKYNIDPTRIAVHGFAGGGQFAWHLAFTERDWVRGAVIVAAPIRQPIPDNDPDTRLQLFLHWCAGDGGNEAMQASADQLREAKFPTSTRSVDEAETRYLKQDEVLEIGRWIDLLDRI